MNILKRAGSCIAAAAILAAAGTAQALDRHDIGLSSTSFASAPARLAKELGLFEKHGIDANFIVMDSGNAVTTALISGSINVVVGGPGEQVAAQGRGQDIVVIANVYHGLGGSLVLGKSVVERLGVSPTAPIPERMAAMEGLVIGSSSATSSYTVAVRNAARSGGAEVDFAYMAQTVTPSALEQGAIDGFMSSAPFWGATIARDMGVIWLSGPKGEFPPLSAPASSTSLQVMRSFADANPELMERFAAVFADFVTAMEERPEEVKAAVLVLYPDIEPATLDVLFESESVAWAAPALTAEDMKYEIEFVKASGVELPQIDSVDPASLLYFR